MFSFPLIWMTCRELVQTKLFWLPLFFLAVACIGISLTFGKGDSAEIFFRIQFMYGAGAGVWILSLSALWTGCYLSGNDMASGRIQSVLTKPLSRFSYAVNRFLGIVFFHVGLFAVFVVCFLIMTSMVYQNRTYTDGFSLERLAGHAVFQPLLLDPAPRLAEVKRLYPTRRVADIQRELRIYDASIRYGETKYWRFKSFPTVTSPSDFSLHFRLFSTDVPARAAEFPTVFATWVCGTDFERMNMFMKPYPIPCAMFTSVYSDSFLCFSESDSSLCPFILGLTHQDSRIPVLYLYGSDGPFFLLKTVTFPENIVRGFLLMSGQIVMFALAGLLTGLLLSYPVALLTAGGYLLAGTLLWVQMMPEITPFGTVLTLSSDPLNRFLMMIFPSVQWFDCTTMLVSGILVPYTYIAEVWTEQIVLHFLPWTVIVLYCFQRRELAAGERE